MKLVFIYGPPGCGKLTVANELAKLTEYKVFHNHLTTDLVKSIFPRETKQYIQYVNKYRLELIEATAKYDVNCIFTFVYGKKMDDWFINKTVRLVEKHGGRVCFVRLNCTERELRKRIKKKSRKRYTKITKWNVLNNFLKKHDLVSAIPKRKSLTINNTCLSAKKTAKRIIKYYQL
jgi:broad-specificity NMP kinase